MIGLDEVAWVEPVVVVIACVLAMGAALLALASLRTGGQAEAREQRAMGCYCPAGRDGYHLPGCAYDPDQEAGA